MLSSRRWSLVLTLAGIVLAGLACAGGGGGAAGAGSPPPAPPIDRDCELHVWLEPKKEERDVPVRAAPEQRADRTGRLPGEADMVRLVVDEIRGRFAHFVSVEVSGAGSDGVPSSGWIPVARLDLDGQWAASDVGSFAPRLFEAPRLDSRVVAVHDAPCGAVTHCGFANDEVHACAGKWAEVTTEHGTRGWLHFDFQCDNRLTTCANKVADEVARFLEPTPQDGG